MIANPPGRLAVIWGGQIRFSSSDYAELTEHSCFTDYARN